VNGRRLEENWSDPDAFTAALQHLTRRRSYSTHERPRHSEQCRRFSNHRIYTSAVNGINTMAELLAADAATRHRSV